MINYRIQTGILFAFISDFADIRRGNPLQPQAATVNAATTERVNVMNFILCSFIDKNIDSSKIICTFYDDDSQYAICRKTNRFECFILTTKNKMQAA